MSDLTRIGADGTGAASGGPSGRPSTTLLSTLGIEHPVVLGPFGGASSTELVAAVSEAGGLGSYGLYGIGAERIGPIVRELRGRTDRPFAVNLWLPLDDHEGESPSAAAAARHVEPLAAEYARLGLEPPEPPARLLPRFEEQFEAVLAARPDVLSLVYGVPDAAVVERCRAAGIRLLATATTVAEARALDAAGVDAIVATGMEAAGHRVSFLRPPDESLVGTLALVPQVVDAVGVPVIAAGGIADGRGLAAALVLGAQAVQVGTAFLACDESAASAEHRAALWSARAEHTELTRAFSGRTARGIPTGLQRRIEADGRIAPFPVQNWLTGALRREAKRRGDPEAQSMWSGQAAALLRHRHARDLVAALVSEAQAVLRSAGTA